MNAGRLRRRVTIQQKQTTQDATGAQVVTWATLATVWAEVKHLQGKEFIAARQAAEGAQVSTMVLIRYRSDIDTTMQVVTGGQTMDIMAVLPDAKHTETQLMCMVRL